MRPIYLLDDHAMMRDGLRAVLQAGGLTVAGESDDPARALADLTDLSSKGPALLLLDLHLGKNSGLELLTEVQRRQLDVRTIVLTMSAQPRHVAEALRLGASGYMLKGAAANELLAAIGEVNAGHRFLGDQVADLAVKGLTEPDERTSLASLSKREREILTLVVKGHSSSDIGQQVHLSPKTVDTYRSRLMGKLGTRDIPALVRFAIRAGVIQADSGFPE